MLFAPDRHEALCNIPWDESRVRAAIQSIVDDVESHCLPDGSWPLHPLDDAGDTPRTGFRSLYLGSAGVLWALWYLDRAGVAQVRDNLADRIRQTDAAYRDGPDSGTIVPSIFLGESGVLLVLWRLTGSSSAEDRLYDSVRANIANPTNEALWGAPGTMLAAWHLWESTREPRWRDLFLDNADRLWQTWLPDPQRSCHLWTQDMYGSVVQYFGAGHGFAGNLFPLLRGASLLTPQRREALYDRCAATVRATALSDGDGVNWPGGTFVPRAGPRMLMQWCHGAPGMVTALAPYPAGRSPEIDAMLVKAGHAIWQAGPLAKGPGLCHGTAGNGYAFIELFRRTGDSLWLDRARAFAMHAIAQSDRMREGLGHRRYTLWTGDPGLAVYAWHCIGGAGGLPVPDLLQ